MKNAFILAMLSALAACGSSFPKVETPGLQEPKISMLFQFPEGSACQVRTSRGVVEQASIPGAIDFPQADRNGRASCTLPNGQTVQVTAHNLVPDNNRVAGITVYPDGRAFITSSTEDGELIQLQPTGTVK